MNDIYGGKITLPKSILDAQEKIETSTPSPVQVERTVSPVTGKKVWETPVLDRGKLRDHLNTLEQHDFEIFQILPIDRTTIQVVCFKTIPQFQDENGNC